MRHAMRRLLAAAGLAFVAAARTQAALAGGMPALDHVFLIVMENRSYDDIIGNRNAPYINQFARTANLATNYFAVGHPSLTNYLEIVGGSNFGIHNDNYPDWHGAMPGKDRNEPIAGEGTDLPTIAVMAPFGVALPAARYRGTQIGDQLVAHGQRWKTYQQSVPESGAVDGVDYSDGVFTNKEAAALAIPGGLRRLYAAKHDPFIYFASVQGGHVAADSLASVSGFGGMNGLYADLAGGQVPALSFIVPDQCHDMHGMDNAGRQCEDNADLVRAGDATVRRLVESIHASPVWKRGRNAIVLVWDENSSGVEPNRVVMVVDTSYGAHGLRSHRPYSHFSLLKSMEQAFGLQCLNHACDAGVNSMTDLFAETGNQHDH